MKVYGSFCMFSIPDFLHHMLTFSLLSNELKNGYDVVYSPNMCTFSLFDGNTYKTLLKEVINRIEYEKLCYLIIPKELHNQKL